MDGLSHSCAMCLWVDDLVTPVVFECWPDVPAFVAVGVPGGAIGWRFERDNFAAWRCEWSSVEIKRAEKVRVRG